MWQTLNNIIYYCCRYNNCIRGYDHEDGRRGKEHILLARRCYIYYYYYYLVGWFCGDEQRVSLRIICASYSRVCTFYAYISCIKYIYITSIRCSVAVVAAAALPSLFAASSLSVRHSANDGPVTGFKKENGKKKVNKKTVFCRRRAPLFVHIFVIASRR